MPWWTVGLGMCSCSKRLPICVGPRPSMLRIGRQVFATLTRGLHHGADLPTGVAGEKLVEPVFDPGKVIVHGGTSDPVRRSSHFGAQRWSSGCARTGGFAFLAIGDYYTRTGLDHAERELITFCFLSAQGGCEPQLTSHAAANMRNGNDKLFLIKSISHCLPFIGYPRSLNALRCVNTAAEQK